MDKKRWMWIHTYLSLFFLPTVVLYIVTGVVAICDLEHKWEGKTQFLEIERLPKPGEEVEFIKGVLESHNLPMPSNTDIKIYESGAVMMGTLSYRVVAYGSFDKQTKEPYYRLMVLKCNLFGIMLGLHVSFNTPFFDIVAVCFSISILIFYLSGLVMTKFCKGKRKSAVWVLLGGIFVIILSALPSL